MPSGNDHQSARLRPGPDGKLYHTIGDQGVNRFGDFCRSSYAVRLPTAHEVEGRDRTAYRGKTLRLNTDGSVPADNPVLDGVRSHVHTYGHRNARGLAFGPDGTLHSNEQGPKTDDEITSCAGAPTTAGRTSRATATTRRTCTPTGPRRGRRRATSRPSATSRSPRRSRCSGSPTSRALRTADPHLRRRRLELRLPGPQVRPGREVVGVPAHHRALELRALRDVQEVRRRHR
ncbi:hypothetical protein GCM10023238_32660 [Streptomyces heliomycini]